MTSESRDPVRGVLPADDEEFVDILEERRRGSDLGFTFRTFSPPSRPAASCSTAELNRAVMDSQFLRYVTREVAMETGSPPETVMDEARGILEEMSQNLQLGFIRLMGFTLTKVFKKLFRSIYVNMDGLNTVRTHQNPSEPVTTDQYTDPLVSAGPGMMQMVLEPFFKGEVFDITLVPVSISYDRVLEESLLAHELLGVPKPKESTAGLLKATRVLQEDYGCMHVNFGRPLSVRRLCEGKVDRCQFNLTPRDLPQPPSAEVQACVSWLAHLVVRVQEEGSVVGVWSLMCCLLLQNPTSALTEDGLPWQQLCDRTVWIRRLALDCGARLSWPGNVSASDVMSATAALHRSVVQRRGGRVYLVLGEEPPRKHPIGAEEGVMRTAAAVLMLASYRNQSLHVFVRPAMLAAALRVTRSSRTDELLSFFCFLQDIFSHEFIFIPGRSTQDFEEACFYLKKCSAVNLSDQEVTVSDSGLEVLSFLQKLLQPFIDSYQLVFRFLCEDGPHVFTEKQLLPAVRQFATKLILSGELDTYEALSSDTQKNVLLALRRLRALTKSRASEQNEYRVNREAVRRAADVLAGKIPPQMLQTTPDARL
ncbi:dihydroxyacetone phosphate acyltransferase-like [Stegastes partitus]|uniref:Dihydroxyacetone phosphate acyltransferase-like n=1 Tax=Stegastes partitus TaxID=144197 RepID=A0A9Y4K7L3_9TELE|nr:PREDICTED: dihydroxyacetone phosphate acyltransferase-like [Stegastes partitus]